MNLEQAILLGGVLHFGILIASALVPQVLDWRKSLATLDPLSRQLMWVHGAFIVLVIIALGLLATVYPRELAAGSPLARGMCLFIGGFWGVRLLVQFFVFDAQPFLRTTFLKLGYHALTVVFLYHTAVFSYAAFAPR